MVSDSVEVMQVLGAVVSRWMGDMMGPGGWESLVTSKYGSVEATSPTEETAFSVHGRYVRLFGLLCSDRDFQLRAHTLFCLFQNGILF